MAEQDVGYFDGIFGGASPERDEDIESVRGLLAVIDEALDGEPEVVLFPVWYGSEGTAPKGEVPWKRESMRPEQFVMTQQFRYTIHAAGT